MAVEIILRCDVCKKAGPKTTTDGSAPRNTIEALRDQPEAGFKRFRPVVNAPLSDLCPKCAAKAESAGYTKSKAKAKPKSK